MKRDPIALELLRRALDSIVEEMMVTVVRTARSQIVRDVRDCSTALCDATGRVIAQGVGIGFHLGSVPEAMRVVLATHGTNLQDGDAIVLNDPYQGGMHLPDIFMFTPVFQGRTLLGFAVVIAHHADIGGRVPGGNAADSTEIFQEGLRIPPTKWREDGRDNETLATLIASNVRVPETVLGDLASQLSACWVGERGLRGLHEKYGDRLERLLDDLLDYAEDIARHAVRQITNGTYIYEDWIDGDGISDSPVRIHVALHVRDDDLTADFSATSPQVPGAINCPPAYVRAAVYCSMRLISEDCPSNEGFARSLHVTTPLGTIVNPRFPAAVAARGVTGYRVSDVVLGALSQAVPHMVPAGNWGGGTIVSIGGARANRGAYVYTESIHGNWGARPTQDGIEGIAHPMSNLANNPVEQLEAAYPLRVVEYGFVPDSEGAGRFRGGLALQRSFALTEGVATLQVRADRIHFPAAGVSQGGSGTLAQNVLRSDSEELWLPGKVTRPFHAGEQFTHVTAGAGGHGDPLTRAPHSVLEDWLDDRVTAIRAKHVYGVVIDEATEQVDELATDRQRHASIEDGPTSGEQQHRDVDAASN